MAPARPAAIKPSPLRKQANTKTSISRKSSALSQPRSNLSKSASSSVISHSQPKSKSSAKPPKPEKSVKPQKPIFKGLSLIIAGTILNSAGTAMSHDSIVQWWKLHGGAWDKEVQVRTTHLICSIDEYKAKGVQVQRAWAASNRDKQCHIVVYDWLEDSLIGVKGKKMKRAEKGYTLDRTIARLKKGKTDHALFRQRFEDGVRASKELCDNRLHKVYYDETGFEYKIVLTRLDKSSDGKIKSEKYTLFFFESIAAPHTYMVGAKLSRPHRPLSYYRETCRPKPFPEAFRDFKHFFHDKTHTHWDDRLEKIKRDGANAFTYTPPVLGRPVGALPTGYVRPEWRKEVEDEAVEYDTDGEVDEDEDTDTSTSTSSTTITSQSNTSDSEGNASSAYATSFESTGAYREPIRNVSSGYGYQPDVNDERFQTPVGPANSISAASSFTETIGGYSSCGYGSQSFGAGSNGSSSANTSFSQSSSYSVYDEQGRYIAIPKPANTL